MNTFSFLSADTAEWDSCGHRHSCAFSPAFYCHLCFVLFFSFYFSHLDRCVMLCNCDFKTHFPTTNNVEHFLVCFFASRLLSLHILIGFFCSYWLLRILYLFWMQVLCHSGPQPFWHQGWVSWKTSFPRTGPGRGMIQVVTRVMGSSCKYRWSFARLPATHLLLHSLVPNRLRTGAGPRPGGWGPLLYQMSFAHILSQSVAWLLVSCAVCGPRGGVGLVGGEEVFPVQGQEPLCFPGEQFCLPSSTALSCWGGAGVFWLRETQRSPGLKPNSNSGR